MAKGGAVKGNTQPFGELTREVVGPPGNTADAQYVHKQWLQVYYKWISSSSPVFRVENPHDVQCVVTDIWVRTTTAPSAGGSSAVIEWTIVASSSAVGGTALNTKGKFSSSIGTVMHYPAALGAPGAGSSGFSAVAQTLGRTWEKNGASSGAWITGQLGPASQDLMKASSAAAQAFIGYLPLYSS